ncbi:MAG: sugar phosphate isomerase/epimerase [Planctomycetes bacterium]|nr:sugar phosphate isomerase/epimerase [Planctomycetota bacterium]
MKFGVNLLLWCAGVKGGEVAVLRKVKEIGYDGVELPIFDPASFDAKGMAKALDDLGLGRTVSAVVPGDMSLASADAKERAAGVDYLKKLVDHAATLSVGVICGPMHTPVGKLVGRGRTPEEWGWLKESLGALAAYAKGANIKLALEFLNRFESYSLNTAADAARLAREVAPNVGVHYDTFHANIEEKDPVAALRGCGDRLFHFHASENDRGIVGTGHVPWRESFQALKDMGYDDWVTVESFIPAIKEIAAAAAIWRELAPSGEELARQSLAFLKENAK